jgi:integrase
MGYNGACRREELVNITIDDIEFKQDLITVSIPRTKNYLPRLFAITDERWIFLTTKYFNLRPQKVTHRRFFLTFRQGKCVNSPIGINTMGKIYKEIASFLRLPNPELYTGHCFRRSSATHLANHGGSLLTIKRHGGWKSSTVAESYVDASLKNKIDVAQMLSAPTTVNLPGCSTDPDPPMELNYRNNETVTVDNSNNNVPSLNIHAHDSASVTINLYNCSGHKNN